MYVHQPVSSLKRISAGFLDFILLCTLAVGCLTALQAITGYDSKSERAGEILNEAAVRYGLVESSEGVDTSALSDEDLKRYDITKIDYSTLSEEDQNKYEQLAEEINSNTEYTGLMSDCYSLMLANVSLSFFVSYLVLEFIVPLLIGNGMTVGKKIFSICVIRNDCVKISPVLLFVRTMLGKYTFETMVPVLIFLMTYFGLLGVLGAVLLLGFFAIELFIFGLTPKKQPLHDLLACTCTADYGSQKIFSSVQEMKEYCDSETDKDKNII